MTKRRKYVSEWREQVYMWLAWRLPRDLVYYCAVRVAVAASAGKWAGEVTPGVTVTDMLERWHEEE